MGETLCGREGNRGPRGEYWQAPPGVHLCTDVTRVLRGNRKSAPTSTVLRDHGASIALPIANFVHRYTSITECRVPEIIPVLGSQPAGDVSHKPAGNLPLLSARPPATLKRAATIFAAW